MTQSKPIQEPSPSPPEPAEPVGPGASVGRLVGVDLARALAVFGMYVVHIGPPLPATHGVASGIAYLADGRSSILFATLAGFSLILLAGRREPRTGQPGRQATARIAIRAVVLLALGTGLVLAWGDLVIIPFYGAYFLLAVPLVRLRARTLAIIAAGLAVVVPQLLFVLKPLLTEPIQQGINAFDPLDRLGGVGVLELLVTGFYPAIPWMTFVVAGLALGRLDLAAGTVRRLARPVLAVGGMSLTAYVGHFVAQFGLSSPVETGSQRSWVPLLLYVLGAMVFAVIWSRFFRRGPLECLLHTTTGLAKFVR